ncbi:MAG TPA: hypothetical protein VJ952_05410 [Opitutales bacterium]|nr:hypothetical protein [Opitutales bacterium]
MKITSTLISLFAGLAFALTASAQNPYAKADGSYISLSGTVVSSDADSFVLDYGEGLVTVEMDDWDWYGDAWGIIADDDVTVYGYVDDDFYETTSIEASSVWVEDLNTYFYASGADEEGSPVTPVYYTTWYDYDYTVTGNVTSVTGREFTVDTGTRKVSVDTWQLGYNPLDDQGYLKIEKGDKVTVYGDLDLSVFDEREISAEAIVKLQDDVGKSEAMNDS